METLEARDTPGAMTVPCKAILRLGPSIWSPAARGHTQTRDGWPSWGCEGC